MTNNTSLPKDLALRYEIRVFLIIMYTLSTVLALTGNALVIAVLNFGSRSKIDVNLYLMVIAISDIAIAIFCIPFTFTETMMGRWIFYDALCPISQTMQVFSVSVSIFTKVALGIDRYLVILKPLIRRPSAVRFRITMLITWTLAVCLSSPMAIVNRVDKNQLCIEHWKKEWMGKSYSILLLVLTYILPLIILGFTCGRISVYLWRRKTPGNAHQDRDELQLKAKRNTIRILSMVVIMFALSWLPLQLLNITVSLIPDEIACDMKDMLTRSYLDTSERNSLYNLRPFTFPRKSSSGRMAFYNGRKDTYGCSPMLKNSRKKHTPSTRAQLLNDEDRMWNS